MVEEKRVLRIHPDDNVLIVVNETAEGSSLRDGDVTIHVNQNIPKGHKVASKDIAKGQPVIRYGYQIGSAATDIKAGDWIHSHNLRTALEGIQDYSYNPIEVKNRNSKLNDTFDGYLRANGEVGIRNELWVIPSVGCVNGIANHLIEEFKKTHDVSVIDDIRAFTHQYGCSQLGEDHEATQRLLCAMASHPNAGGVLILGLGCENNRIVDMKTRMGSFDENRIRFLVTQETDNEIEEGTRILDELFEQMKHDKRTKNPISKLRIGLKCGGSDGFSGITANPLLGELSDLIIENGGSTALTEVPEMFGAETILMNRAESNEVFVKITELINDFKQYYIDNNQPVYENPSPGNKDGGITTLEEKSLGCVQKGGHDLVSDVIKYAEPLKKQGLTLIQGPGNDLISSTALAASGCQMVIFSTGRGTPFGTFVPTMKVSTNTKLYESKKHWIDFNAGVLVENKSLEELKMDFLHYVLEVASGSRKVNAEKGGYKEIAVFKRGVTL